MTDQPVALVTGAAGGIGGSIVTRLMSENWQVIASDLRPVASGDATLTWTANVTDEESVAGLVAGIQRQFGRLDAVVTCAGVIDVAPVAQLSKEQWERVLSVNLTGTFLVIRDCLPLIRQSDRGRIICISSDAGKTGEPGIAHYCASKFGVIGFAQSLALELAREPVTVNCVCPVICETDMMESLAHDFERSIGGGNADDWRDRFIAEIPMGRACHPDDVANVVSFLSLESSAFVSGQAINVSGCHEMH